VIALKDVLPSGCTLGRRSDTDMEHMAKLFTQFKIGSVTLANRIVIAPMCQYSAVDGCMTDWHLIHLGHLALSGAALLTIEATALLPEGGITYVDVGLWCEETKSAIARGRIRNPAPKVKKVNISEATALSAGKNVLEMYVA
jgi:NADH:flavin oxidoreductase / NADH oxidase family